jgi:hypothetical protein
MKRVAAVLLGVLPCVAGAHDVVVNRLTLVQRETNHVSMTLVIDYISALKAVAAPGASFKEFVIACSGMPDAQLQRTLSQAQTEIEQGIVLQDMQHRALRVTPLRWPSLNEARKLFQHSAMAAVALGTEKAEPTALELTADVVAAHRIESLDVQLPAALADMLVISYKPVQTPVDPQSHKARVKF